MDKNKIIKYGLITTATIGVGVFVYSYIKEYRRQYKELQEVLDYNVSMLTKLEEQNAQEVEISKQKIDYLNEQIQMRDQDVIVTDDGISFKPNMELEEMRNRITNTIIKKKKEKIIELKTVNPSVDENGEEVVNSFNEYGIYQKGEVFERVSMKDYINYLYTVMESHSYDEKIEECVSIHQMNVTTEDDLTYIYDTLMLLSNFMVEYQLDPSSIDLVKGYRTIHEYSVIEPISFAELIICYALLLEEDTEYGDPFATVNYVLFNLGLFNTVNADGISMAIDTAVSGGRVREFYGVFALEQSISQGVRAQYDKYLDIVTSYENEYLSSSQDMQ